MVALLYIEMVINKAANLATIPTREHFTNSLANYVMSYYKQNGIVANTHFVSRLDAPTSGLIMWAPCRRAQTF